MSIMSPVATCTVNGHPVRYFKAPRPEPDFPWHAYLDLLEAMALPAETQEHFLRVVRSGPYRDDTRVVATADGPVVIAPHHMAQGFIGALVEIGKIPDSFERFYHDGLSEAMTAVMGDLPPIARFEMAMAMAKRHVTGEVAE